VDAERVRPGRRFDAGRGRAIARVHRCAFRGTGGDASGEGGEGGEGGEERTPQKGERWTHSGEMWRATVRDARRTMPDGRGFRNAPRPCTVSERSPLTPRRGIRMRSL